MDMITKTLSIKNIKNVDDAPKYGKDTTMLRLESALVVKRGTVSGAPTVDLQLVDADGNKFLVMATGAILSSLSTVIAASAADNGE